ncbi:concanavalin A-like lectin/glucanase domain-containing protein [Aspergillus coremiiformis]|uniref:Concanavalin A-like lectin/glucanase domain-containing protein n=1 Tax=Aspergillus coremiiformis TaxID=138285 RepID=A0A5N6ZJ35_9EURO|nr:concanavalin A-like lectin/glucanase domain-containing protein [Aspergillus coremiiformis]
MQTTRLADRVSTAEIEFQASNILHCSRSKTCESDIEILTSDPPHTIHYSNQPDYDPISDKVIPGAGSRMNISVPWTAWVTHRLDWFPNISRWYTGEVLQLANSYGVPREPSTLVLNLWSDGGNWTGDLRVGESVFLGVEWIELVFNVSEGVVQPVNRGKGLTRRVGLAGKPLGDIPRRRNETGCRRPCYLNDFH